MKSFTNINPVFSESIMIVEPTDPVHSDNANASVKQLLANTQVNRDTIEQLKTSTGNTEDSKYNANGVYKVGDYCIYNNELYKCIVSIDEPEEWNKDHWEKTTITEELLDLNNKEVEVVDPMTATEEGFAADAKLTGDALRELSVKIISFNNLEKRITDIEKIQNNYASGPQSGQVGLGLIRAGQTAEATVAFPKLFTKTPTISISLDTDNEATQYLTFSTRSVNASSFVVTVRNISDAAGAWGVKVNWRAYT